MALFLTPLPWSVLRELETRSKILGDSSRGKKVDLTNSTSVTQTQWKLGRTPFVRAASFAVMRDNYTYDFQQALKASRMPMKTFLEKEWSGGPHITPNPHKNHHRLKNILWGGGLIDQSNSDAFGIDNQTHTNIVDDFSGYNSGYAANYGDSGWEGHRKLKGYKSTNKMDYNTRPGVPMPGITSVTVENVGALGSLKKIDMEVECHDFAQLQMIESLYMSPGVTVLLEWGWSIDTAGANIQSQLIDLSSDDGLRNVMDLHNKVQAKGAECNHSYEGAIATITNYNWSAKDNGSFGCQISLRSRGEAMLGTNVQSAHAPLIQSVNLLTTDKNQEKYLIPTTERRTKENGPGRKYDSDANLAQDFLQETLYTQDNRYYPSVHAGGGGDMAIVGKLHGPKFNSDGKSPLPTVFPRFYYTYKMKQAGRQRNQIIDRAKNSIASGKKVGEENAKMAEEIVKSTIATYVQDIVAPAMVKNSVGGGTAGPTKHTQPLMDNGKYYPRTGHNCITLGLQQKMHSTNLDCSWMQAQPADGTVKNVSSAGQFSLFEDHYEKPWPGGSMKDPARQKNFSHKFFDLQDPASGDQWNGVGQSFSKGHMMYRPYYNTSNDPQGMQSDTNATAGLLFGAYYPMGSKGWWSKRWKDSLMTPLTFGAGKWDWNKSNLFHNFYDMYRAIHVSSWTRGAQSPRLKVGIITPDASVKYATHAASPLSAFVAHNYIGFSSFTKGNKYFGGIVHNKMYQKHTDRGLGVINASLPLTAWGNCIKAGCQASDSVGYETLGFKNFPPKIIAYVKKHYKKVPDAADIAAFIGGRRTVKGSTTNTIISANYEANGSSMIWGENLDMVVGKPAHKNHPFGLPKGGYASNSVPDEKAGRWFGAVHVSHTPGMHVRLKSGVNGYPLSRRKPLAAVIGDVSKWGIYGPCTNKKGYDTGNTPQQSDPDKAWPTTLNKELIRTLPSAHFGDRPGESGGGFKHPIDYPMPMWGHYSKIHKKKGGKQSFKFVDDIRKGKANFLSELAAKKSSAALAMTLAFSDAYSAYEEYRKITDGDVFMPYSVLEQLINDNIGLETAEGQKYMRFDSGDQLLAGPENRIPQDCVSTGRVMSSYKFETMINEFNDDTKQFSSTAFKAEHNTTPGIGYISIEGRLKDIEKDAVGFGLAGGDNGHAASAEDFGFHFGFSDISMNHATYFYAQESEQAPVEGDESGPCFPGEMYQLISLPSKICNHKYLASTDPRICILPGQTGVTKFSVLNPDEQIEFIGDNAEDAMLKGLSGFKRFTDDDPDKRRYGYLPNILINTEFIHQCFHNATTIKDALQKVLDGVSSSCGNIWNFKFMIDGDKDSGTTRIVDANYANNKVDTVAEFPVHRTDSIIRSFSLQSKIPNAMAVMALYGNNTPFDDGSIPNSLYELGNMFVDLAHENIQMPINNSDTEVDSKVFVIPKSNAGRVSALAHLLTTHIHENLADEHVHNADKLVKTILNDKGSTKAGDNALLDHNIVPVKMSFELDGISGITFGHAVTATHLPERYRKTVCFQVTNVKHSITPAGWTTSVEAIMRRRPHDMGVHRIGDGLNQDLVKLEKDTLVFDRAPNSWLEEDKTATQEGVGTQAIDDIPGGSIIEQTDPLTETGEAG